MNREQLAILAISLLKAHILRNTKCILRKVQYILIHIAKVWKLKDHDPYY